LLLVVAFVSTVLGQLTWRKALDAEAQVEDAREATESEAGKARDERAATSEVRKLHDEAVRLSSTLAEGSPTVPQYTASQAVVQEKFGLLLQRLKNTDLAEKSRCKRG
jgi:hypothetical protein